MAQRTQRGSALTEFAIIVPMIVGLVYGSLYLSDAGVLKLRAQEVARYAAWSMAVRPMSDFETLKHQDRIKDSQEAAADELEEVYLDLDAARRRAPMGASRKTMAGVYTPGGPTDLRVQEVHMVPGSADREWSSPMSTIGVVLSALNIGNSVGDLFAGPFKGLKLNMRGEVHGRAPVLITPPLRPSDVQQSINMASLGRDFDFGLDLRRHLPRGRRIRDTGPSGTRDIEVVLIADDWRLDDGATAKPDRDGTYAPGGFRKAVGEVSARALEALPGGPLLAQLSSLVINPTRLPPLGGLFGGQPAAPQPVVKSRPLTLTRDRRPSVTSSGRNNGQANMLIDTDAEEGWWEDDGVQNFETNPLYETAEADGGYLEALERRGSGFLGCPEEQRVRCDY